nr:MAG TPA: hypothetical protein [Caudoviricetes sp.]
MQSPLNEVVNTTTIIIVQTSKKVNKIEDFHRFFVLVIDINKSTTLLIFTILIQRAAV